MKVCTSCGAQNQDENYVCTQCNTLLSNFGTFCKQDRSKIGNILTNIFGIIIGISSLVLGIITFTTSSISEDSKLFLLQEIGSEAQLVIEIFTTPAKAFSFGMGSLLLLVGLCVVLCYVNKIVQRNK